MSFAVRTFIQTAALVVTLEAALFLAKGGLGLSAEDIALLSATRIGFNPELTDSLAQQQADTWIGVVLLLFAFLLQMWNALWPLRMGISVSTKAVLCVRFFFHSARRRSFLSFEANGVECSRKSQNDPEGSGGRWQR